jgi:hypothetical protein
MSAENPVLVMSGEFSEAVSTQYLIAKMTSTENEFGIADDADVDVIIGVFQNTGADGGACSIAVLGVSKVKLGTGGCSIGSYLTCESGGKAIVTATLDDFVVGRALKAGDADDIVPILLTPGNEYHFGAT